ncbi:MAG: hypothetical protein PHH04_00060 [Thomasclavelia sp.]|nr:hypothetical protein [Thomasclavelia sp.]
MNKLKKILTVVFAMAMAFGLTVQPTAKVQAYSLTDLLPMDAEVNMTSCTVVPVGDNISTTTNADGNYELSYDTNIDKYNITYDAVMDVTQMWEQYDSMVSLAEFFKPTSSNYINIAGDFNASISFDSNLDIDSSKFSVDTLNASFKAANPTMWEMFNVTTCNYDDSTRTLSFTVHLDVASTDFKQLINDNKRTNTMSVRIPEGALSIAKEDITDGMNITVTGSNFGGNMTLTATGKYEYLGTIANIDVKSPIGVSDVVTKVDVVNVPNRYTITTNVTNGTVVSNNSTTDKKTVDEGNNYKIEYQPNDGYVIDSVKVDGVEVDASTYQNSYSFTNITANHIVDVVYKKPEAVTPVTPSTNASNTTSSTSSTAKTGDNTQILSYVVLGAAALVCLGLMTYSKKKRHN